MNILGKRLKELRLEKKFTCQFVANSIGLTKNAITNYESGTREPSISMLKALCDLYDVSADYLIGRTDSY